MNMTENWTPEQIDAITGRDDRLLVAAAAGAGKTAVLVERIIRRITDPADSVDVDRLLVVTFTNAAAAEMRERIGQAINRELKKQPGSTLLHRQLALLQRANISTLHSFCLELVRQHFYQLELDPGFRVTDDAEAALLQLDVLEDVFEGRFAAEEQSFLALADCYGGQHDDTGLQELVLELYKFSRSTPDPGLWLNLLPERFSLLRETAVDELPWFSILKGSIQNELNAVRDILTQAMQISGRPDGPQPYLETLQKDMLLLNDLVQACAVDWDTLYRQFNAIVFSKLASCKKGTADEDLKNTVQKLRNTAKDRVQKMRKRYFNRPAEILLDELQQMAPLIGTLTGLVGQFATSYRQAKKTRGVADFSDLEHYALQILRETPTADGEMLPSSVALELRGRFAEVLVDEYQDINAVQETILSLLCGSGGPSEPGLFMVGDVKQSIYRFRLSEPGLFMDKYHRFAAGDSGGRLITLTRNYRSRQGVVDGVNYIFRQIMSPAVGEMDYAARDELVCSADYPARSGVAEEDAVKGSALTGGAVEMHLIDLSSGEGTVSGAGGDKATAAEEDVPDQGTEPEEDLDALQLEARTVGRQIIRLMEEGFPVYDNREEQKGYRPLTYRDVVVLLRATTGRANVFVEEFGRLGIPTYAELNTGYFAATEVETMLALLKIIDNPRQDVPLAAVLRSPLAGFDSEDLAQIRFYGGPGDFYDAVVLSTMEGPEELAGRLVQFLKRLERWRTMARRSGLAELVWSLYRETGYYDFVGGLPGGSQRQANLRALYSRVQQYEATSYRGLFRFMRFVERIRDNSGDMGAARSLGENENVVRIMSIHKSKGLEFPVVIVAGLGKMFNFSDLNKSVLMHRDLGLGPQLVDARQRIAYPTVAKLALREKLRAEALAEEMRVLYVAMTRAREKLILVGGVRRLGDCSTRWCAAEGQTQIQLPAWLTSGARHYLDWLGPALVRHRDGAPLRELAGTAAMPLADNGVQLGEAVVWSDASNWRLFIWDSTTSQQQQADALPAAAYMEQLRRLEPVPEVSPLSEQVEDRLNWSYSYQHCPSLPARVTVTGLKYLAQLQGDTDADVRQQISRDEQHSLAVRPLFVQKKSELTAAERGQALHLVMQLLDLKGNLETDGISEQIALMVEQEKISRDQAAVVQSETVAHFWRSSLGQRILQSSRVYRELPFTLALSTKQVYPGLAGSDTSDEAVLVQGIIDCLADEGEGLLLIDYKTDRYTPGTLLQTTLRYNNQLDLYITAAERITGRRVTAAYFYMFYGGDVVVYNK